MFVGRRIVAAVANKEPLMRKPGFKDSALMYSPLVLDACSGEQTMCLGVPITRLGFTVARIQNGFCGNSPP